MKLFRLGTTVLAHSTLTLVAATGDCAAATSGPAPPTIQAIAPAPSDISPLQVEPTPNIFVPDLTVRLARPEGGALEPGESFRLEAIVRNAGRGSAQRGRVIVALDSSFSAVRVIDARGINCTVGSFWVDCTLGWVPEFLPIPIVVEATAPQAPGDYGAFAEVDPQQAVDESDENNNVSHLPLNVRYRD